jgi:hypothetical protein
LGERKPVSSKFFKTTTHCLAFALIGAGLSLLAPTTRANHITGTHGWEIVARLTGTQGSSSINPTWDVGIGGTDLGHMVNHNGKVYFLFGDTFNAEGSGGSGGPDWRQNVMAYSTDFNPADGITFNGWITRPNGTARQVIAPGTQPVTYIPTGAISVGDKIYTWYMHVTDWSNWTLDHAGLAWWREGDSRFTIVPDFQFAGSTAQGTQGGKFGMVAASYRSPLENANDEHIYIWGTGGGRLGGLKLARVMPNQIENISAYEYFGGLANGTPLWTDNEFDAPLLINDTIGEMSVMYNEELRAWTLMYHRGSDNSFQIRQADSPWGVWSAPKTVTRFEQAPGLYAPYMNPLLVEDNGKTLYFTMSLWNPYDVYLAKVTLDIDYRTEWIASTGTWASVSNWSHGRPTSDYHVTINNGGMIWLATPASARAVDIGTGAEVGGRIELTGSANLTVNGLVQIASTGVLGLSGGKLIAAQIRNSVGGAFNFNGGTLHVGTFTGNLINANGVLAPGNSIGTTNIMGNYAQQAGATLAIEISGLLPGTQHDRVDVTGNVSLDGKLQIALVDGFMPATNQTFTVLSAAGLTGTFANVAVGQRLMTHDGTGTFVVDYGPGSPFGPNAIVISGFQLSGDFNNDGQVDVADYVVWRKGLGTTHSLNDFDLWRARYGDSPSGGASSSEPIAEPASVLLLSSGALVARRRLRRLQFTFVYDARKLWNVATMDLSNHDGAVTEKQSSD